MTNVLVSRPLRILLVILFFCIATNPGYALHNLAKRTYYAEAPLGMLLEQAKALDYQKNEASFVKLGYSAQNYWFRFEIENPTKEVRNSVITIPSNYFLDTLVLYTPDGHRIVRGDTQPHIQDLVRFLGFYFPVSVPPGRNEFYLNVTSEHIPINFEMSLYDTEKEFIKDSEGKVQSVIFVMGFVVALILYSAFLYFALKNRSYRFYAPFALCTIILHGYRVGVFGAFFAIPALQKQGWLGLVSLELLFACLFLLDFLREIFNHYPVLKKIAKAHAVVFAILVPFTLVNSFYTYRFILFFLGTGSSIILVAQILSLLKMKIYYYVHFSAWIFVLIFGFGVGLAIVGIVSPSYYLGVAVIFTLAFDASFTAVALGLQTLELERQKVRAQKQKKHTLQQLSRLVYPHQLKGIEKGAILPETMPVGIGGACVISFDIQGSASLGYDENHDFFKSLMRACHKAMVAYYDGENLRANAFLIKEMGDGFLCSVGFPFACEGDIYQNAISLSEIFIQVFDANVKKYLKGKKAFASIGIAYGDIRGGFPKYGIQNYDLHGDAIVKATRYEAFRKMLFKERGIVDSSVIIVQEAVANQLPKSMKVGFEEFSLDKFRVRDDEKASRLYYRVFC